MSRIVMVLTRDLGVGAASGRERTLQGIRGCIRGLGSTVEFRLKSLLEDRRPGRIAHVLAGGLMGLLRGRPEPLQCLLFRDRRSLDALARLVRDERPDVVYLDSIRTAHLVIAMRKLFPALRLVVDMDDLMSRRYHHLREAGIDLSLGYLASYLPRWVRERILNGLLRGILLRYEAATLSRWERRVVEAADAVTLVSLEEVELLRSRIPADRHGKVHWIPPIGRIVHTVQMPSPPLRFIFVGTDSLMQNRLAIEWLVERWRRGGAAAPLHIFGKMRQSYQAPDGVHFAGFVDSLDEVYTPGSILLAPSFIPGGVKTKVMEALGNGTLVVGSADTFEGLGLAGGGLALTEGEMEDFIRNPQPRLQKLLGAALEAQEILRANCSEQAVCAKWSGVMRADPRVGVAQDGGPLRTAP
jgi:glycosyltransferase involved in cell wall biosynthesis